jgi:TIR domain
VLAPILEVHVVWHPGDREGLVVFESLLEHFHGTTFSGLVGGAVEVYQRSQGWEGEAPRPLPIAPNVGDHWLQPRFVAVVPVLGARLARAAESPGSPWRKYVSAIAGAWQSPGVGVFPVRVPGSTVGPLSEIFGQIQALAERCVADPGLLNRELAQQIAQRLDDPLGDRLTVFLSHTKRGSIHEENPVDDIVARVRRVIASTHLSAYFDAAEVQPGDDWASELESNAARSAMLVVRTDLYAGREWCQREVRVAKEAGVPIVALNAVRRAEERGSFLMDHMPVVGYSDLDDSSRDASIETALNLLVDGALKRAIWRLQSDYLIAEGFDWLPLNAPEPVTLIPWLAQNGSRADADGRVLIMHPDPPLGPDEQQVIEQVVGLAGLTGTVDVLTPRTFSSRGGEGA